MERAKDLTKFLNVKLKKIVTIEAPNFWRQSSFPEAEGMVLNDVGMLSKAVTANQADAYLNNFSGQTSFDGF